VSKRLFKPVLHRELYKWAIILYSIAADPAAAGSATSRLKGLQQLLLMSEIKLDI